MKKMKISKVLMLCAISFAFFNCSDSEDETIDTLQSKENLENSQNSNRNYSVFGNGVNIQASYYNGGNNKLGFDLLNAQDIKNKIKTVRIEIDPRYASITTAKKWIQDAQNSGFQVIATYHRGDKLGSNDPTDLYNAAYWWKTNYVALGGDFYINLMNEWGNHYLGATTYKNAYSNAMNVIRSIPTYKSKPIIIDLAGWGQDATKAASIANQLEQSESNFIFSLHIYNDSYNSGTSPLNTNHLQTLYNAHPNCIVGEFGFRSLLKDNPIEQGVINNINKAKLLGWPQLAWCWTNDGHGMNMIKSNQTGTLNYPLVHISNTNANPYVKIAYFNNIYLSL